MLFISQLAKHVWKRVRDYYQDIVEVYELLLSVTVVKVFSWKNFANRVWPILTRAVNPVMLSDRARQRALLALLSFQNDRLSLSQNSSLSVSTVGTVP